ncbi:MAG: hypothetical protein ACOC5G_03865 [Acidobacteriota bacterium]
MPEGYTSSLMFHALDIDEHFLDTYGIEVVKGRNFNKEFSTLHSKVGPLIIPAPQLPPIRAVWVAGVRIIFVRILFV